MRCRARFQAAWWDHPRLGVDVGAWPSDGEMDGYLVQLIERYESFADTLGERLPPHRRALYEGLFANASRLAERFRSRRHQTIIQGDAHVGNCFLPKDAVSTPPGTPRLFDWDGWRPSVGADDLAYMIAMWWFPETRQRTEDRLLDAFHKELSNTGVAGYDRRALQDDYRLTVLWEITRPIWLRAAGLPPGIWWSHIERIHLFADDLDCRELLG